MLGTLAPAGEFEPKYAITIKVCACGRGCVLVREGKVSTRGVVGVETGMRGESGGGSY